MGPRGFVGALRARWTWVAAITGGLIVVLAAVVVVVVVDGGDEPPGEATPLLDPAPRPSGEPVAVDSRGGTHAFGSTEVTVPAGAVPDGAEIEVSPAALEAEKAVDGERYGPPVHVDLGEVDLNEPITVSWDVSGLSEIEAGTVLPVRWDEEIERWVAALPEGTTYEVEDGRLNVTSTEFSFWDWVANTQQSVLELTGQRTDGPSCRDGWTPPHWVENVVRPDENLEASALRTCLGPDKENVVTVRVVNNRTFAQRLHHTDGGQQFAWRWYGDRKASLDAFLYRLAAQVMDTDDHGRMLLPPLTETSFGLGRPAEAGTTHVEVTGEVDLGTAVVDIMVWAIGKSGVDRALVGTLGEPAITALFECGKEFGSLELNASVLAESVRSCAEESSAFASELASLADRMNDDPQLAVAHRHLSFLANRLWLLDAAEVSFYLSDQLAQAMVGRPTISANLTGTPQPIGGWEPTCDDLAADSDRLYRNLALAEPYVTDRARDMVDFDQFTADAPRAVEPLNTCDSDYRERLADHLPEDWGDQRTATALAEMLGDLGASTINSGVPASAPADRASRAPLLVLMDLSSSMNDDDGTGHVKLDGAKQAMADLVTRQRVGTPVGLWTYPNAGCAPGSMVHDVGVHDPSRTAAIIRDLSAHGDTPTGDALATAADALRDGGHRGATIVLVSDGESNCGEPPCEVARRLVDDGFDVTVSTVGFRTSEAGREELECISSASGGRYYDVENSDELADELRRLTGAQLDLDVSYQETVPTAASTTVRVEVSNASAVEARNVRVSLSFTDAGESSVLPAVLPPQFTVGNLPAGESLSREWVLSFREAQGGDLGEFTVSAWGTGVPPARATGRVTVTNDPLGLADGGDLLSNVIENDGTIAIMGDSYSSGEGGGEYLPGTDTSDERCHRSTGTYLSDHIEGGQIIACSGAVVGDFYSPKADRENEPAQLRRLDEMPTSPDIVFLTIGGNDADFGGVLMDCLLPGDCTKPSGGTVRRFYSRLASLETRLSFVYRALHETLNGAEATASRGGRSGAVVVLAYPRLIGHHDHVSCHTLSRSEIRFFNIAAGDLNATIDRAVERARDHGANVYFAGGVEQSVLPNHGACSSRPYINPVNTESIAAFLSGFAPRLMPDPYGLPVRAVTGMDTESLSRKQEFMHPNRDGYRAMTNHLIQGSRGLPGPPSPEAAPARFDIIEPSDPETALALGEPGNGSAQARPRDAVEISASGFAPGSSVGVKISSTPRALASLTADEDGQIQATVHIPADITPGRHEIEAAGFSVDGDALAHSQEIEIGYPRPWWHLPLILASALFAAVALAIVITMWARRESRTGAAG